VGKTKRGKGSKVMAISDASGLPVSVHVDSASPHEITLVAKTIAKRFVKANPRRIVGDRAYDSDPLDKALKEQGIEMISPHKSNRKRVQTQDGRPLRRYRKRWKVERLYAWLQNFRKIVTRYEYHAHNFLSFVLLGCMIILLRNYF
jgi:transposase